MTKSHFSTLALKAVNPTFRKHFRKRYGVTFVNYLGYVNRVISDPSFSLTMRKATIAEFEARMAAIDEELDPEDQLDL